MLSLQHNQSIKQLKKRAPIVGAFFEAEPPYANSISHQPLRAASFWPTNHALVWGEPLAVNQYFVGMGVRLKYAGMSECNTPVVWSPCGQMPRVWGDTKGFHWKNSKSPESCGSSLHPGIHVPVWHHTISTTTSPAEFDFGATYICLVDFLNCFCPTECGPTRFTEYIRSF